MKHTKEVMENNKKLYPCEKEILNQFIDNYDYICTRGIVVKNCFNLDEKNALSMIAIQFCLICEQRGYAHWGYSEIDNFVTENSEFHNDVKVFRDSYLCHLDHSAEKEQRIIKACDKYKSVFCDSRMHIFYDLTKKLLRDYS